MIDDVTNANVPTGAHEASISPQGIIRFREFCALQERRSKKSAKTDVAMQLAKSIDILARKVNKQQNQKQRDRSIAQQNKALALLAIHLSKTKN